MDSKDQVTGRALFPLLLGLTDVDDGSDPEQKGAGLISQVCRLLALDVLYTVRSIDGGWVKVGFALEGALGALTVSRPTGIVRHVLSKKTRMLQRQVSGRGAFHRYQDGWPGREASSFLAVPLRRRGSIAGVLVLLRGPHQPPFELEEFEMAERVAEAIEVRHATARTIARLTRLARTDEATGLANERAARLALEREVERSRRLGGGFSIARIVVTGLDHLPRSGEVDGVDAILAKLAKLVTGVIRGSDLLSRFSADQMLMILPDTTREGRDRLLGRVDTAIRTDCDAMFRRLRLTLAFAGASYPADGVDAASLLSGLCVVDPAREATTPPGETGEEKKRAA